MTVEVPDRPSDLGIETQDGKDSWWPTQQDTIGKIVEAFGSKKYVLVNAPPGSGKTIIATAVQRLMQLSSVNLTHTIQLQEQYTETLPWATVVTGRRNHRCERSGLLDLTAEDAPCSVGDDCEYISPDGCSYYKMLFEATSNPQAVINYAYATRILQLPQLKRLGQENPFRRELLVCDEGDLAEGALIDAAAIGIVPRSWNGLEPELPPTLDVEGWVGWARAVVPALRKRVEEVEERYLTKPSSTVLKERGRMKAMHYAAEAVRAIPNPSDWLVQREGQKQRVVLRPLWGWAVAGRMLWDHFPRVLIMSATLGDPKTLTRKLGIPREQVEYIDVASTFPAHNRLVFYWPVVKVDRRAMEEDWDRLASAVRFLASQPALRDKKGLIHTASFAVANSLEQRLPPERFFTHTSQSKSGALARFQNSPDPLVLLSPSFTTGLDLPYMIGWQVVAKVPFADLGNAVTRARREYKTEEGFAFGSANYRAEAMNAVVQACGRAVRAPDDRGVSYILDGNFWPLYKGTYSPQHFRDSLRWVQARR